uniref:Uncharacterized LOC113144724 n=1 Tax=Mastacembelus armatus TaxID=205130 RepID=A0A7N8YNR2_9TELE
MLIIFYFLLMLQVGRCTYDHNFVIKTAAVGENVVLTCTRQPSEAVATLYWIKFVAGNVPEILGKTFNFDHDEENRISHITTKQEPEKFVLHITDTKLSDTAFYYCLKTRSRNITFVKGIFLRITGPESNIIAVIQDFSSDPVRPGDSVTLQCSVLSDSESDTCPRDHSVYWFRAGSDESLPSLIYAPKNSDQCERSPEVPSQQKCVYNFSKNISSSDAGTYYCAVATCGQILFGNGTKLDIEGTSLWSQSANAIMLSLIVITFLICAIKKNKCDSDNAAVDRQTTSGGLKCQQRYEDAWDYSAVIFTVMKTDNGAKKAAKSAEREKIYAAVKAFRLD